VKTSNFAILKQLFSTLYAKLNLIFHLLALLEAHHILHISRIRVNSAFSWKFEKRKNPPKPVREFYILGTRRVRSEHVNGYITAARRSHLPTGAV